MTYMNYALDRICKDFCPLCSMCEREHECKDRIKIKKILLKMIKDDALLV